MFEAWRPAGPEEHDPDEDSADSLADIWAADAAIDTIAGRSRDPRSDVVAGVDHGTDPLLELLGGWAGGIAAAAPVRALRAQRARHRLRGWVAVAAVAAVLLLVPVLLTAALPDPPPEAAGRTRLVPRAGTGGPVTGRPFRSPEDGVLAIVPALARHDGPAASRASRSSATASRMPAATSDATPKPRPGRALVCVVISKRAAAERERPSRAASRADRHHRRDRERSGQRSVSGAGGRGHVARAAGQRRAQARVAGWSRSAKQARSSAARRVAAVAVRHTACGRSASGTTVRTTARSKRAGGAPVAAVAVRAAGGERVWPGLRRGFGRSGGWAV